VWSESSYSVFVEWIMSGLQARTRVSQGKRITIVIHSFGPFSAVAIHCNESMVDCIYQPTDSARFKFFFRFFSSRRFLTRREIFFYYFEGLLLDFRLLKAAKRISPNSPLWEEALKRFWRGDSDQQILEFLELAAMTEGLSAK